MPGHPVLCPLCGASNHAPGACTPMVVLGEDGRSAACRNCLPTPDPSWPACATCGLAQRPGKDFCEFCGSRWKTAGPAPLA